MARSLYREWFVHFRFPCHESVPRVPSPLGEIPQGWEVKKFTEIADVLSGGTPKTDIAEYWNGEIPFFTPRDVPDCFYVQDTDKHVTDLGLSKCASANYPPDTVSSRRVERLAKSRSHPYPSKVSRSASFS
jgi:type I restriction enzyme S subunit